MINVQRVFKEKVNVKKWLFRKEMREHSGNNSNNRQLEIRRFSLIEDYYRYVCLLKAYSEVGGTKLFPM